MDSSKPCLTKSAPIVVYLLIKTSSTNWKVNCSNHSTLQLWRRLSPLVLHLQVSGNDFHFVNFKDLEGIREIYTICGDIIWLLALFSHRMSKQNESKSFWSIGIKNCHLTRLKGAKNETFIRVCVDKKDTKHSFFPLLPQPKITWQDFLYIWFRGSNLDECFAIIKRTSPQSRDNNDGVC